MEANGNTFNRVSVQIAANWGHPLFVSNVTGTGTVVADEHVYIRVGENELVVEAGALRRALNAVREGTRTKNEGEAWW